VYNNKLIAAGILSVSLLALSVPAMAFSNKNYSGRYACHEDDGTGYVTVTNLVGGITATYVVEPNGAGAYNGGELVLNISALFGDNPCTFTLNSWSSYWIDSAGVVHEDLEWSDWNSSDICYDVSFYHYVEASLALVTPFASASSTATTANTDLAWAVGNDVTGTGTCTASAN
jgi:hypothetical protein